MSGSSPPSLNSIIKHENDPTQLKRLIVDERKIDPCTFTDRNGLHLVHMALIQHNIPAVRFFMDHYEFHDPLGWMCGSRRMAVLTPLIIAISEDMKDVVNMLIYEYGAPVSTDEIDLCIVNDNVRVLTCLTNVFNISHDKVNVFILLACRSDAIGCFLFLWNEYKHTNYDVRDIVHILLKTAIISLSSRVFTCLFDEYVHRLQKPHMIFLLKLSIEHAVLNIFKHIIHHMVKKRYVYTSDHLQYCVRMKFMDCPCDVHGEMYHTIIPRTR